VEIPLSYGSPGVTVSLGIVDEIGILGLSDELSPSHEPRKIVRKNGKINYSKFYAFIIVSTYLFYPTFGGLPKREDNIFELSYPERVESQADET
jgi:hypothetical protein